MSAISLKDLSGRYALVTGSSSGIGRATCDALLVQGAIVFGVAIDQSEEERRTNFIPVRSDLSNPGDIRSAFEKVLSKTDRLDYVVNVAGIDSKYSLAEGDETKWQELIDLNLRGYYLVIREALTLLREGRGKSIVNVSSINYRLGVPRRSIYSISKAGILGLTTGLARELGAEGIRINSVSPGWVFTEGQVAEYFTRDQDRDKYLKKLKESQSIDREISPEDVVNHILFYLSEASAASTGHNCVVDGGWLLE
jgi:NAD(P)-dependent dehydrogenase (short-subunit alcohol dehydrogenase family)